MASRVSNPAPSPVRPSLAAPIAVTVLGLATFSVMDGVMKAASIAVGAYSAMFWRNLLGAGVMIPVWIAGCRRRGGGWLPAPAVRRVHLLRSSTNGVMAGLFFYGTVHTPLAEAMALSFIAPLIALFLAAAFLGERLAPRAVAGSLAALAGVGVIAAGKLGGHYAPDAVHGMIAILVSAVLYAVNLVLQRRLAQIAEPDEIAFFQSVIIAAMFAPGAWWLAPVPPLPAAGLLLAGAVLATMSLMLVGWAYARAPAQKLVPLEYTAFIWAALVGWMLFGEPVTLRTLAGVALIVAGCLLAVSVQSLPDDHGQPNPA